jgi:CBS domain-containing protein
VKVADVMTSLVEFIDPDATVQDAAALMGELDVSALPVGTATDLQGIVTDRDILYRAVAEGRDPRRTRIYEVATHMIFTCSPGDTLISAMDLMAAHNIRRLPVVGPERQVVGWLTLSDLSRRLLVDSQVVQNGLRDLAGRLEGDEGGDRSAKSPSAEPGAQSVRAESG